MLCSAISACVSTLMCMFLSVPVEHVRMHEMRLALKVLN